MIAVVVPAHNEEESLPACLSAMKIASRDLALKNEAVLIVVVLDACTDNSEIIAHTHGVNIVYSNARNVGATRALGATFALQAGARWLAFTDADSEVPEDWLSRQLSYEVDAVCGIVSIKDWSPHPASVRRKYLERYTAKDGHRHIHGANLGISAHAYRCVGGFSPLAVHEDVALVEAVEANQLSVAWVAAPCVWTHSRPQGRAPGGFAAYLCSLRDAVLGQEESPIANLAG